MASFIITGAFLPGIKAVQTTISIFFNVSVNNSSCFFLNSPEVSFAYPPDVSRFSDPSTTKNLLNFVINLYDKKNNKININLEDEIIKKTLVK